MRKLIALILIVASAAVYAHYRHWTTLPLAFLPRQEIAEGATTAVPRFGFGRPQQQTRERPPVPVLAVRARSEDVPVTADAAGTIQARNTATVRAQVEGRLLEVVFKEGQEVNAGDVLARIDPRTYQAQYDQVVAKLAQDSAQLANARLDLERYIRLAATNSGSKQQADTQRALVAQLEAQLKVNQALVDAAKTQLDFTTLRAPISGRTGIRLVDAGNIVRGGDATGLVTITQVTPISLVFNLPQQQLQALRAALQRGEVPVQALEADNRTLIDSGRVDVIDNLVDVATGTVKIKAQFANTDLRLWPGQFVNVRVFLNTLRGVTTVPAAAIQRGPVGPFVYVVNDGKVAQTNVTLGLQNEAIAVIAKGVEAGAVVVTSGFGRLNDDATVTVTLQDETNPAPAAEEQPNNNNRRRGRRG
jgi:multidrug efflux system membrane fusion protein